MVKIIKCPRTLKFRKWPWFPNSNPNTIHTTYFNDIFVIFLFFYNFLLLLLFLFFKFFFCISSIFLYENLYHEMQNRVSIIRRIVCSLSLDAASESSRNKIERWIWRVPHTSFRIRRVKWVSFSRLDFLERLRLARLASSSHPSHAEPIAWELGPPVHLLRGPNFPSPSPRSLRGPIFFMAHKTRSLCLIVGAEESRVKPRLWSLTNSFIIPIYSTRTTLN